jgi:regulator of RNase E activity RraA
VTDGPGRDYAGIAPLDFPVFCDGCVSSHGYNHMLDLQTPVQIGGISVAPGELLHGDANGVTTIPLEIAADVADACVEFAAAEQVIIDVSQSGAASLTDLREAYAEKARRVADLGEQLRARKLH